MEQKYISFVFDDGPKEPLCEMVDKFVKYGFKCGFAVIGKKINNDTIFQLKYAIDNGCSIVSHGENHVHLESLTDLNEIKDELLRPIDTVEKMLGYKIKMARLPFLSCDKRVLNCAKELKLPLLGNGINSAKDWRKDALPEEIEEAVINSAKAGAIGCLHVCESTCEALDVILPRLKEKGFVMVTPEEIFEKMGIDEISLGIQINNVLNA